MPSVGRVAQSYRYLVSKVAELVEMRLLPGFPHRLLSIEAAWAQAHALAPLAHLLFFRTGYLKPSQTLMQIELKATATRSDAPLSLPITLLPLK